MPNEDFSSGPYHVTSVNLTMKNQPCKYFDPIGNARFPYEAKDFGVSGFSTNKIHEKINMKKDKESSKQKQMKECKTRL